MAAPTYKCEVCWSITDHGWNVNGVFACAECCREDGTLQAIDSVKVDAWRMVESQRAARRAVNVPPSPRPAPQSTEEP